MADERKGPAGTAGSIPNSCSHVSISKSRHRHNPWNLVGFISHHAPPILLVLPSQPELRPAKAAGRDLASRIACWDKSSGLCYSRWARISSHRPASKAVPWLGYKTGDVGFGAYIGRIAVYANKTDTVTFHLRTNTISFLLLYIVCDLPCIRSTTYVWMGSIRYGWILQLFSLLHWAIFPSPR